MYQYPLISRLLHPYTPLLILLGMVVGWVWFRRRFSLALRCALTIPYVLLLATSLPAISHLAFFSLERSYPPMIHRPGDVEAIVILGGYVDPPRESRNYAVPGADTLARCLHGASLFREGTPCWTIVVGGKIDSSQTGPGVAEVMRDFLVSQQVPQEYILLEDQSRNTYENAVASAKLLRDRGLNRAILVTDAASLSRATKCFHLQGFDVIPSGCRFRTSEGFRFSVGAFLPSIDAAQEFSEAWHEWLGLAWYWLRGRI